MEVIFDRYTLTLPYYPLSETEYNGVGALYARNVEKIEAENMGLKIFLTTGEEFIVASDSILAVYP